MVIEWNDNDCCKTVKKFGIMFGAIWKVIWLSLICDVVTWFIS